MGLLTVKVDSPKLSNFDRSLKKRATIAPGILVPILMEHCLPGDQIKMNIKSLVKTYPLLAPLMGTFKVQFDMFFCPWRLYCSELGINGEYTIDGNATSAGTGLRNIQLPYFRWPQVINDPNFDLEASAFSPAGHRPIYPVGGTPAPYTKWSWSNPSGSFFDYMGIPAGYFNYQGSLPNLTDRVEFNAIPYLAYVDIFRNYYANRQESTAPLYGYGQIALDDLDTLIRTSRAGAYKRLRLLTNSQIDGGSVAFGNFGFLSPMRGDADVPFCGLFARTYRPDMYETILDASQIDALNKSTRMRVQGDSSSPYITYDQFLQTSKFYKIFARGLLGGSRMDEWVRAQFGIKTDLDSMVPQFLGSTSTYMEFEDVVSNSNSARTGEMAGSGLGDLAGRGVGYLDGSNHYFKVREHGTLMVILSIQPLVDYYQGISYWNDKTLFSDFFVPGLEGLGFEDIMKAELTGFYPTTSSGQIQQVNAMPDPFLVGVGKRPAWLPYMTNVNRLHGQFAQSLRYWAVSRTYQNAGSSYFGSGDDPAVSPLDSSAYINPRDFNYAFTDSSASAENFLVQVSFDMLWKRPMSKRLIPGL